MAMECAAAADLSTGRPRKRARLGWDVAPATKTKFTERWVKGETLFQTHENLEHLAMMERILGPLPRHMLKKADHHAEKYIKRGRLNWPEGATRESIRAVLKLPRLQNLVMQQHVDHSAGDFIDLPQDLLAYEPSARLPSLLHKISRQAVAMIFSDHAIPHPADPNTKILTKFAEHLRYEELRARNTTLKIRMLNGYKRAIVKTHAGTGSR